MLREEAGGGDVGLLSVGGALSRRLLGTARMFAKLAQIDVRGEFQQVSSQFTRRE